MLQRNPGGEGATVGGIHKRALSQVGQLWRAPAGAVVRGARHPLPAARAAATAPLEEQHDVASGRVHHWRAAKLSAVGRVGEHGLRRLPGVAVVEGLRRM